MSSTVENIHANILTRISKLINIINIYNSYELSEVDNKIISNTKEKIDVLSNTYELGSINILSEYYQHKNNLELKNKFYNNYMNFITLENIIGNIKRIYLICKNIQKSYYINDDDIDDSFNKYEMSNIIIKYSHDSNNICICGNKYNVESKTSEFICYKCGNTEKLYGMIFEDDQFFYQEGQRTKHGKYDPTKHCKFWLDRIQAKENTEIPKNILNCIKKRIKHDKVWISELECTDIRKYLKICKLTSYNNHIPLILKKITGKEPSQLTDYENKLVYVNFAKVIPIYNKIKPEDKPNSPYHPFFIYKIIEQILKSPEQLTRKKSILSCIHLQSRETLIENDNTWKLICEEMEKFTYIPTDSS